MSEISIDSLYEKREEVRKELRMLYESESFWRSALHDGCRNRTKRRNGKLQKIKNKIMKEINRLKIEQSKLTFEIKKRGGN